MQFKLLILSLLLQLIASYGISRDPHRIAILDFDNTSGIEKYDGLGKAMANMLISDLNHNIPRSTAVFIEREQIQKILNEQEFQKSLNVDKSTAVSFGKIAGVNYVLTGSVFVLDGTCNINARLINVEDGVIQFAEESNGEIQDWLLLKSNLAKLLANSLNMNLNEPSGQKKLKEESLLSYTKAIIQLDNHNYEGALGTVRLLKLKDRGFPDIATLSKTIYKSRYNSFYKTVIASIDDLAANYSYQKCQNYLNLIHSFRLEKAMWSTRDLFNQYAMSNDKLESINSVLAKDFGIDALPSIDAAKKMVSTHVSEQYQITEYILSKDLPKEQCGEGNPIEMTIVWMLFALDKFNAIADDYHPGIQNQVSWIPFVPITDENGIIIYDLNNILDLYFKYSAILIENFPYSRFLPSHLESKEKNVKKEIARLSRFKDGKHIIDHQYFTDSRDKQKYKTVKIGDQVWMAENLNYDTDSNSLCYNNELANCEKYGRLYNWETAMKACPSGWHIPADTEWQKFYENSHNESGFTVLFSGYYDPYGSGSFYNLERSSNFWTATETSGANANDRIWYSDEPRIRSEGGGYNIKTYYLSVRCVKD